MEITATEITVAADQVGVGNLANLNERIKSWP